MKTPDLATCTLRETMHINGGAAWFGYGLECNEHPRLSRIDRYDRKTKAVTVQWQVDGEDVASLDEAAVKLSEPPTITDQMREDMATIGPEYADHRKTIGYPRLKKLERCGLLEWGERGKCRIRQLSETRRKARR